MPLINGKNKMLSILKMYLQAFYGAFYNKRLYREVVFKWYGTGALYLLLLSAVVMIPVYLGLVDAYKEIYRTEGMFVIEQIPDISIKNGTADCNAAQPYKIIDINGKTRAIIDTKKTYSNSDINKLDVKLLLTKRSLIIKNKDYETSIIDLRDIKEAEITSDNFKRFMVDFNSYMKLFGYPIGVLFFWAYKMVYVFVMAFLSMFIASFMQIKLDFIQRVRIAAIAITPMMIANMVFVLFGMHPVTGWRFSLVTIIYIFTIIRIAKEEKS
ncbi:MAG: DUF1189 family protein [Alphaproteobacteria bacterium]|nr:DUF1189 family protein [Alphaproteobacteria bacterium]